MITEPEVERYCLEYSSAESNPLQKLREYTLANVAGAHMLSGVLVGRLLQFLVQSQQAKSVLDIGTFTGYSALSLAEALPPDGKVMTCDQDLEILKIAQQFFKQSSHGHKIEIFAGLAADCIEAIEFDLDFVFIDADKKQIKFYLEQLYPKLRQGGLIAIDNVLWGGEVVYPLNERAQRLHALNLQLQQDPRFTSLILPIRDGLTLLMKT